ncbi:MAG: hypothetical protein GY841_05875 [FCB group bacterium]|nr:hypothetical protein [FCB group bacterium]
MDTIAENYVKLLLRVEQYNDDFVDAYCGPEKLRPPALDSNDKADFPFDEFLKEVTLLLENLEAINQDALTELEILRKTNLEKNLIAAKAGIDLLNGRQLTFDEESRLLYDAVAPQFSEAYFDSLLKGIDGILPGKGELAERHNRFVRQFIIPADKLDKVLKVATADARQRTGRYIDVPDNEKFEIAYVTDQPWTGYNWYKGNNHSLMEINTELPIYIDWALSLACHEGYPGHHVQSLLVENHLYRGKGWVEFSIYPLYCPASPIYEGAANYGVKLAFPEKEQLAYEKEVLYPLAGIDPELAEDYLALQKLKEKLRYSGVEVARRYLDGKIDRAAAKSWIMKYSLDTPEEAENSIEFIEKYRTYIINYSLGEDMVKQYIDAHPEVAENPDKRWALLAELFTKPIRPSAEIEIR